MISLGIDIKPGMQTHPFFLSTLDADDLSAVIRTLHSIEDDREGFSRREGTSKPIVSIQTHYDGKMKWK